MNAPTIAENSMLKIPMRLPEYGAEFVPFLRFSGAMGCSSDEKMSGDSGVGDDDMINPLSKVSHHFIVLLCYFAL